MEKEITVMMVKEAEDFIGLLGKAKVLGLSERMISPPEPFMAKTMEFSAQDAEYDVELLMVCDRGDSVILSKEGSGHRAIISSGTVVDYFINRIMDMALAEAGNGI